MLKYLVYKINIINMKLEIIVENKDFKNKFENKFFYNSSTGNIEVDYSDINEVIDCVKKSEEDFEEVVERLKKKKKDYEKASHEPNFF